MKNIFYITVFILSAFSINAQTTEEETVVTTIPILREKKIEEPIRTIAEKMPEFPGGEVEMLKFIADNTVYPPKAKEKYYTGKVFIRFVVDKEGDIYNITCLRGPHPLLNNAAMEVVNLMPKWKPGTVEGVPYNVWYTIPIVFNLN